MARNLLNWLDSKIFQEYPAAATDLAVCRLIYSTYLLIAYLPIAPWLQHTPEAFFKPPLSFAALFTSFPPFWVFLSFNVLLGLVGAMLLVGLRTRFASAAITILLLVMNSWAYSLGGKVNHDILFVVCPLVLMYSGWGDALSLDSLRSKKNQVTLPRGSWCMSLLAWLIAVAMF